MGSGGGGDELVDVGFGDLSPMGEDDEVGALEDLVLVPCCDFELFEHRSVADDNELPRLDTERGGGENHRLFEGGPYLLGDFAGWIELFGGVAPLEGGKKDVRGRGGHKGREFSAHVQEGDFEAESGSMRLPPSFGCLLAMPLVVLSMNCASSQRESAMGEWPTTQVMDRTVEAGKVKGYVIPVGTSLPGKGAELTVTLVDATVAGKSVVVSSDSKMIDGKPPYAFSLAAGDVKGDRVYEVWAEIKHKKMKWGQMQAVPVLTGNTPSYVEIEVVPR